MQKQVPPPSALLGTSYAKAPAGAASSAAIQRMNRPPATGAAGHRHPSVRHGGLRARECLCHGSSKARCRAKGPGATFKPRKRQRRPPEGGRYECKSRSRRRQGSGGQARLKAAATKAKADPAYAKAPAGRPSSRRFVRAANRRQDAGLKDPALRSNLQSRWGLKYITARGGRRSLIE